MHTSQYKMVQTLAITMKTLQSVVEPKLVRHSNFRITGPKRKYKSPTFGKLGGECFNIWMKTYNAWRQHHQEVPQTRIQILHMMS